jgi:hypothetical protein
VVVVVVDSKAAVRRAVRAAVRQATKRQERVFQVRATTAAPHSRTKPEAAVAALERSEATLRVAPQAAQAAQAPPTRSPVHRSPTREAVVAVAPQLAAQAGQVAAVLGEATPQAPTALRTSAEAAAVRAVRMSAAAAARASSSSDT